MSWSVGKLITDFGHVEVVPMIFMPRNTCLLVDRNKLALRSMDAGPHMIEVTLVIRNAGDGGHALIQNVGE